MTATTTDKAPGAAVRAKPGFYMWTAIAMAATAFIGFAPTFWLPMAQGVPENIGVIALHATLFYGWNFFLIYQTWLVTTGNTARHRDTGMIGISLATAMVIFGTLAGLNSLKRGIAAGYALGSEAFLIVPLAAMFTFAVLVIAAIMNVRNSEWHKRFMIVATAVILEAAVARLFITFVVMGGHLPPFQGNVGLAGLGGPPPPILGVLPTAFLIQIFPIAGMVYDWRTRGKVHPAYWWACGFALAVQLLKIPFSDTAIWHGFARWLLSLTN